MTTQRVQINLPRLLTACALLFGVGLAAFMCMRRSPTGRAAQPVARPMAKGEVVAAFYKLPLVFEKNQGQTDPQVKFLARAMGYTLFLTGREVVLRLSEPRSPSASAPNNYGKQTIARQASAREALLRLALRGSDSAAQVEGMDGQPGHSNYLMGRDPSRWQRNVPLYSRVKYHDVYPGIDAVYYGNQSRLETDYIVAPGSDPNRIALHIDGAKSLKPNAQGDLAIASTSGDWILRRPDVYQEIDGRRREIAANYVERGTDLIGIQLGAYDSRQTLIIDPVLDYSTFLGGTGGQFPYSIAVDSSGNAYVTGDTNATDFPTTAGAYQTVFTSSSTNKSDAFITKLNATGTALVFSTFLGGSASGAGNGIAVDPSGNVFVAGTTAAADFPVTSATAYEINAPNGGVFVSELDPTGATLLYSTYLAGEGGAENATSLAIALNPNTLTYNAYVLGRTADTNFPITATAFQTSNNTNQTNPDRGTGFLSRIDPSLAGTTSLIYSTYLGGSSTEFPAGMAVDSNENAYMTGSTTSSDFPVTASAFQSALNNPNGDIFISRIDTTMSGQSSLIYSTYFGGSSDSGTFGGNSYDIGQGIAVQPNAIAVVVGYTYALTGDFPLTGNALVTTSNSPEAIAFLARFDTTKSGQSALLYSSYWGGTTSDLAFAGTVDSAGNIYMVGTTSDTNFPTTPGAPLTTQPGRQSAFVSEFDPTGANVLFSTYWGIGTPSADAAQSVAVDSATPANIYFTGETMDNTFPTTAGAYQTTFKGTGDVYVTKMSPGAVTGVFVTPSVLNFGNVLENTTSSARTVTLFNNTQAVLSNIAVTVVGTNSADFAIQSNACPVAPATLAAGASCAIAITFTPTKTSFESATLNIADSDASSPQTVSLSGTGTTPPPGVTLSPSPVNFGSVAQGIASSPQGVTLLNNSSSALTITSVSIIGTTDFAQTNNCPASPSTLASGAFCTITVTFTPSTTGNETATLQVMDSDPSSPQTDTLSGTGTAPPGSVTATPPSINFGNVNVNATSPAQTVTLTNSKTTTLTINSISITGTNASDFAAASKCGKTLGANSNCTISVTFTPTTTSAESSTLSISDSDSTSPQTVALSGTGVASQPDFTISASPASATVSSPGTIMATITVASVDGFTSPVTLGCSSLPGDATCSFSQNPLTPAANGTASSTVTISTSVGVVTGGLAPSSPRWPHPPTWIWMFAALGIAMAGMSKTAGRKVRTVICAFALLSIAALASCTGTPSTPTGTYRVNLTGQAGLASHAFKFMLTVK
jgi:Beta-propeller repeat/Abnormal spindle-like microcephaly-assoc'd, ASPM-SPD-2-Hydin